ncbi:endonuclease [Rhodohalobacter sp. 8-1]|uniref:endonuclease n=1 Tax=Rhodohalobacter sp. 8-1 TaxID=3131972 RepID=UPI0030EE767F
MIRQTTLRVFALCFLFGMICIDASQAQNQTIGGDLTGESLQEFLRENYTPNRTLGYSIARDRMYTILDNRDGKVIGVYTYFEMPVDPNSSSPRQDAYDGGDGINAEHLWPQSLGAGSEPARSDLHHLRSTEVRANQDRGNLKFGTIPDNEVDRWYNKSSREETGLIFTTTAPPEAERDMWSKVKLNDRFESKLDTKGDIARSMFYFYTIYRDEADAEGSGFFSSMDDALLEWHDIDEVDGDEVLRTETISNWQGNVNPFVMDTTLVRRAFFMEDGGTDPNPDPEFTDIFTETFGTVSSSTDISEHTFDNDTYTFEGNGDIRESLPSEGYEAASGNAQVFMNLGYRYFTIGNINTNAYEQLAISFGVYSTSSTPLTIEYRTESDGLWTDVNYDAQLNSGSWSRVQIQDTAMPAAETLAIRFSKDNGQQYRLDDIHLSGVQREATSSEKKSTIPGTIALDQNYPNPFNPATVIKFNLPENQRVKLAVYDMLGREVAVLVDGIRSAGSHDVRWNALGLSSGIYMYTLQTESSRMTRKMTLMK